MALNAKVVKEGDWGVLLQDEDQRILIVDPDTAIKLGIHLMILGQDALHAKALQMVCMDKQLPADTFVDLFNRMEQYITILNATQKDTEPLEDGNDSSD
jgi:hypothetical protein